MKNLLLMSIRVYQMVLSPDHGWLGMVIPVKTCRFYPTCSEYAKEAIIKKGALRGIWLTCLRVCKCHPWHPGGIDNVK